MVLLELALSTEDTICVLMMWPHLELGNSLVLSLE